MTLNANVTVSYFSHLAEITGVEQEQIAATNSSIKTLYLSLQKRHGFLFDWQSIKPSCNHQFCDWDTPLQAGDNVVFITPVSGG